MGVVGSPTTNILRSVALSSASEGWAVGDNVTLRLTGGTWATSSNQSAYSIALSGPDQGWALSNSGILRLGDGTWTRAA